MNKLLPLFTFSILFLVPVGVQQAFAAPMEMITNGDFETGAFAPWSIQTMFAGSWNINNGGFDPAGPTVPAPPISGSFDAVSQNAGPGTAILSETFVVPSGVIDADVAWNDRIFNIFGAYADPNQEIRVEIRDSTGTIVLAPIFDTDPGDITIQPGPNARAFDITTDLQALEGQTVRLCFTVQGDFSFLNLVLDDISLIIDTDKVSGEFSPIDSTALVLAGLQSSAIWMLPVLAGAVGVGAFYINTRMSKE